jgi:hypothetical protein
MKNFLVVLVVLSNICFFSSAEASRKLHLPFNEVSGVVANDYSGNANNGTVSNATFVAGLAGTGLDLNGSTSYVKVLNHSTIQNIWSGGGTVSAWIYPRSAGENGGGGIINKDNDSNKGWFVAVMPGATGLLKFQFRNRRSPDGQWSTVSPVIPINTWTHVVITYDDSNTSYDPIFYVNGIAIPISEGNSPGGVPVSDVGVDLYAGTQSGVNTSFDGIVDDVVLDDEKLSPEQIHLLYQDGLRARLGIMNQFSTGGSICIGTACR